MSIQVIFWDFDGVLIDSGSIREDGFRRCLANYSEDEVERLIEFHRRNGGLSRYVKFRYFFEQILKVKVEDDTILRLANRFSEFMRIELIDSRLLINDTLEFISNRYNQMPMHIVSGSDQAELQYLCEAHGIAKYFRSIGGSPKAKNQLIAACLSCYNYNPAECVLVGDSINDFDAAVKTNINFVSFNNPGLEGLSELNWVDICTL